MSRGIRPFLVPVLSLCALAAGANAQANDNCLAPVAVPANMFVFGNNSAATDTFSGVCSPSHSDLFYSFTAPSAGEYLIEARPLAEWDIVLSTAATNCGTSTTGCADAGFDGEAEFLLRTFAQGEVAYIRVAAYITSGGGSFSVAVFGQVSDCPGDFNDDGVVNATDIFIFLDAWFIQNGQTNPGLSADIDNSGTVDATDIFVFLDIWFANNGTTCPV